MTIKAIVFDIGGVLDKGDLTHEHYMPMCKEMNVDFEKFSASYKKHSRAARVGKLSVDGFISNISHDIGVDKNKLLDSWTKNKLNALKKDRKVEATIKKLIENGYLIGTLTDIIELHHQLRLKKGFYELFKIQLCSFKEGLCKTDMRFFELLLKRLGKVKPEEVIFVDDVGYCVENAQKLGIKTILFKNNTQLVKDLKDLGVKI